MSPPRLNTQPDATPYRSTRGNDMGIRIVSVLFLILLFAKVKAYWKSHRLSTDLATLRLYKKDVIHRFMQNAASNTSTQNQDQWQERGASGDGDRLVPLDKLNERCIEEVAAAKAAHDSSSFLWRTVEARRLATIAELSMNELRGRIVLAERELRASQV